MRKSSIILKDERELVEGDVVFYLLIQLFVKMIKLEMMYN